MKETKRQTEREKRVGLERNRQGSEGKDDVWKDAMKPQDRSVRKGNEGGEENKELMEETR